MSAILRAQPDVTFLSFAWDLKDQYRFKVSRSTVQKAVQQRGWTMEKAFRATEQDAERIQESRR